MSYTNYLKSQHWKRTKENFFNKKSYRCSICGAFQNLILHHKNYKRLNFERTKDLTCLCESCHNRIHNDKNLKLFTLGERWMILHNLRENRRSRRRNKSLKRVNKGGFLRRSFMEIIMSN